MKFSTDIILENITKEAILEKVTEYDVYSYYMPYNFKIGNATSSPFRVDTHPSFGIFKSNKTGALLFKDQVTGETGDCFKFVKLLKDLTYKQTFELIWSDIVAGQIFKSKVGTYVEKSNKQSKLISVKRKNFTQTDDDYWGQYYIDRTTLKKFKVSPISHFWVNDIQSSIKYTKLTPIYAYRIFNSFKIYNPLAETKKDKWRSNCSNIDIQGWEQLPDTGDLLIITKALKDIMVLSRFNIPSIAPQAENTLIPKKVMNEAKKRFKTIVCLYDYDDGGMQGASKMKETYNIPSIFIPKHYQELYSVKDISDHIKEFGIKKTKELLNELLNGYKS